MLKFIRYLFEFYNRHYGKGYRYTKDTKGRVVAVITEVIIVLFSFGLEFWALSLWSGNVSENWLLAFIVSLLAIGFLYSAVEFCAIYTFFGFTCAITGSLEKFLSKASDKRKKKYQTKQRKKLEKTNVNNDTQNESFANAQMLYNGVQSLDTTSANLVDSATTQALAQDSATTQNMTDFEVSEGLSNDAKTEIINEADNVERTKKKNRKLDWFVGFFSLALTVGTLICAMWFLALMAEGKF